MILYGKQTIDDNDIEAVVKTLKSNWLTTGPKVLEFEEEFASYVGAKYAVAVSSGTAALHLACLATDLKNEEELITSPMTFVASANCALYCGAKPVFVDIKEKNGLIDEELIEEKITPQTKIIIPVHYAGLPYNMKKIKEIADKHKLIIIEDACHALGAEYGNTKVGDCTYSDMTVFSFHPVKHITTGEGGMITTNSEELYQKLLLLRSHGITKDPDKLLNKNEGSWFYETQELGFNYRITDFQCALGISQLKKIESFVDRRIEIAKKYDEAFSEINGVEVLEQSEGCKNAYHLYIIKAKDKETRLRLFNYLKENDIFCQVHYIPVHWHPYYQKLGYRKEDCPKAGKFYEKIISLPIYPSLKEREQDFVIEKILEFIKS
jgi:UDP-4-amino-4,6-dideoxy-N-acetyl-beta-L-altrosamine transaminase